ncbi:OmpA family protein [Acinetobacter chinensis]|uniref:OmpA family protein n=1 Tax=Acinetobacter chinensis TaxID=2004650 RepID=A0A3B7LTW9_9GAMM|nr:OmpA family protein [Acinetobacter chinensis]AXY55841.1 OmpA family protein [Acinetobacter chinensis]
MLRIIFKSLGLLTFTLILTACMGQGNLNYKQSRMLKNEGFILENNEWTLALPERLLFEFDQSSIPANQKPRLVRLSSQLKKYNLDKLTFTGHSDNIGQSEYNLALSEKRAQSVAQVFLDNGFQSQNIKIRAKGASQPLVKNDSDEHRAINRRVNITIIP